MWVFITNLGDTAVTLPLALLTCSFLAVARQTRLAFGWGLVILGCAGAISGLKLMLAICDHRFAISGLHSPSGHTAMSTAVYGSMSVLIAWVSPPAARALAYLGGLALIAGIAASRLALRLHTRPEVVVGLVIGLSAVIGFRMMLAQERAITLPIYWLIGAAAILVIFLHGERWPAEQALGELNWFIQFLIPICS
jgi:membrane-associated phospholipid phosphatase